jgi:hypothetical protein
MPDDLADWEEQLAALESVHNSTSAMSCKISVSLLRARISQGSLLLR